MRSFRFLVFVMIIVFASMPFIRYLQEVSTTFLYRLKLDQMLLIASRSAVDLAVNERNLRDKNALIDYSRFKTLFNQCWNEQLKESIKFDKSKLSVNLSQVSPTQVRITASYIYRPVFMQIGQALQNKTVLIKTDRLQSLYVIDRKSIQEN